jgi:transposase-like protein
VLTFPKNLREFDKIFASEEECISFLEKVRWARGFVCQSCGREKYWQILPGIRRCQGCRFKNHVKVGTIFESSRLDLRIWFQAIWWITSQKTGVSALSLQKNIGLGSYRTAWLLLHKIRNSMIQADRSLLRGEIEVDEAFVGGVRAGKRGRGAEGKQLVVIAAECDGKRRVGRARIQRIPDASGDVLESFIMANVESGSVIHTDGWPSYNRLRDLGFKHKPRPSYSVDADELLPRVNIVTSLLKRWLMGTLHGRLDPKHMDHYFEEFIFRFNRRTSRSRGLLFQRVIENSVRVTPAPYKEIKSRKP